MRVHSDGSPPGQVAVPSDPTRRAILARLADSDARVTDVAQREGFLQQIRRAEGGEAG